MGHRLMLALGILALVAACTGAQTPKSPAKTVRIALLSDPHINLSQSGEEALYQTHFAQVIQEVNEAKVDMVLIAGDLTQSGKPDQIAAFIAQTKGFTAPVKTVLGNHDVGAKKGITGAKPEEGVNQERVIRLEKSFGPSFFAYTISGVRILGINASLLGSGLTAEARQWAFLERELALQADSLKTPVIILSHYPLYLESSDEPGGVYWNIEPAPRERLLSLIEQNGMVHAFLSGHIHRGLTAKTASGVLLYSTPPVSFGLPRGQQSEGWSLITLSLPSGKIQAEFRPLNTQLPRSKP